MVSDQQRITVMLNLVAQLRELQRLRERLKKAELSTRKPRLTAKKKRSISRKRPPGTKRGCPVVVNSRLSPLGPRLDLKAGVEESLNDDFSRGFTV